MKKSIIMSSIIILIAFIISIYVYPQMPDKIASHWDHKGQVDGYISKSWGLFLMPVLSLVILALFIFIPKIDPLKKNLKKFRKYYDRFIVLFILFLFYIYLLTIFWNLNYKFNMTQMIIPAFGILFYYIGILTENAKQNWFIGIKTPWTLSNNKVWEKTHKVGGQLFKIAGLLTLIGILFPNYAIYFFLIPVLFAAIYSIIYSYFEYQKLNKQK